MLYYKADRLFQQPHYLCSTIILAELFARVRSTSPWPNSSSHVEFVRLQVQCRHLSFHKYHPVHRSLREHLTTSLVAKQQPLRCIANYPCSEGDAERVLPEWPIPVLRLGKFIRGSSKLSAAWKSCPDRQNNSRSWWLSAGWTEHGNEWNEKRRDYLFDTS